MQQSALMVNPHCNGVIRGMGCLVSPISALSLGVFTEVNHRIHRQYT